MVEIFINKAFTGNGFSIEARTSDTIDDLKQKIQETHGVSHFSQRLFHGVHELVVGTLRDSNIESGSRLDLVMTNHFDLRVKLNAAGVDDIIVCPNTRATDRVNDIKQMVLRLAGVHCPASYWDLYQADVGNPVAYYDKIMASTTLAENSIRIRNDTCLVMDMGPPVGWRNGLHPTIEHQNAFEPEETPAVEI